MNEENAPDNHRRDKPYSPHYKADDSGGFGNPPVRHQFAPGNPGGPGRPKGQTNIEAQLRKVLGKKVTVNKDGQPKQMHVTEVFAERMREAILARTTSPAMLEYALRLLDRFGPQPTPTESPKWLIDLTGLTDDELQIYGEMGARVTGQPIKGEYSTGLGAPGNSLYRLIRGDDGLIRFERVVEVTRCLPGEPIKTTSVRQDF